MPKLSAGDRIDELAMIVFNMAMWFETHFVVTETLPEKAIQDWQGICGGLYNAVSEEKRRVHASEVEAERLKLRNGENSTDSGGGNR